MDIKKIIEKYDLHGEVKSIQESHTGNINSTYIIHIYNFIFTLCSN